MNIALKHYRACDRLRSITVIDNQHTSGEKHFLTASKTSPTILPTLHFTSLHHRKANLSRKLGVIETTIYTTCTMSRDS